MELEVGAIVKLSSDSKWYNYGDGNPVDIPGKIISITDEASIVGTLGVVVEWDNGTKNVYRVHDLVKVHQPHFEDSQVL